MKTRFCYVSNSSSSSFIVVGKRPDCVCLQVPKDVAEKIVSSTNNPKFIWDGVEDIYITQKLFDDQLGCLPRDQFTSYVRDDSDESLYKTVHEEYDIKVKIALEHLDEFFLKKEFRRRVEVLAKEFKVNYKLEVL